MKALKIAFTLIITVLTALTGWFLLDGNMNLTFLNANILVFLSTIAILFKIFGDWEATGRVAYGVAITYVINVVITCVILNILGYRRGFILIESNQFLLAILSLQFLFFWLSFGIDPQNMNLRKRLSYWLNKLYAYGIIITLLVILKPMVTGDISSEEMNVNADRNKIIEATYQVKINLEMAKYVNVQERIDVAIQNNNLDKLNRLQELAETTLANMDKLKKGKASLPSVYDDGNGILKTNIPVASKWIDKFSENSDNDINRGPEAHDKDGGVLQPAPLNTSRTYTFTGIGYTGGEFGTGGIRTLQFNMDVKNGDTIYMYGHGVQIYSGGKYRTLSKESIHMNKGWVCMRAPKGEKFTVKVI